MKISKNRRKLSYSIKTNHLLNLKFPMIIKTMKPVCTIDLSVPNLCLISLLEKVHILLAMCKIKMLHTNYKMVCSIKRTTSIILLKMNFRLAINSTVRKVYRTKRQRLLSLAMKMMKLTHNYVINLVRTIILIKLCMNQKINGRKFKTK